MIQNRAKIIGITGGIATGKSTVVEIIKSKGYFVIDADEIAKDVVKKGSLGLEKIKEKFGSDILLYNGELNREKLAEIIFTNEEMRKELNEILHPIIINEIIKAVDEHILQEKVIFIDVPLLFESKDRFNEQGLSFDEVWLVYCDEQTQIDRLMKRDKINYIYALNKIKSQLDLNFKKENSDVIIYNNGDLHQLEETVEHFLRKLSCD
ncbi:MAG TPA: dephospho-CoA kinase [Soehngenia sp.]|nr:dephospho-CoA kinase [Soehngenia sp.]HPP31327.1 dephospho-CoA kinase [Soehngenia sp.]